MHICTTKTNETLKIIETNADNKDFITLCDKLYVDLNELINLEIPKKPYSLESSAIEHVFIVYLKNVPIACASYREYNSDTVELKRVFLDPSHRNKGICQLLLSYMEKEIVSRGYKQIILETRKGLDTALIIYNKLNYKIISNFKPYENSTDSICMCKIL
ncbi:MAG: GNAT family N-acetyltransferase [Lachnospiraceae bacterium]|jgi:GNAT superfamily N-acetyltransferase|nr:GNAT family N-acetyltransferase [Lachnospiraceae bacterium]